MSTKNKSIQIPQNRLDELLVEVTGELNAMLKSEGAALAKAAGDDEPEEESSGSEAGAPADDIAPEAPPAATPDASPPAPEASAPEASPPPPGAAPPDASAPGMEASAAPSLEELVAAYSELPPEQLDMHLQAATMAAQASASPGAGAAPPAPPAPPLMPPAPPAAAPEASAPPMMGKTEGVPAAKTVPASQGSGGMRKTEKNPEIELLKQQIELQKKEVETRDKALTELVKAMHEIPTRKAGTRISEMQVQLKPGERLAKTEGAPDLATMNRDQAKKILAEKARDRSLSKSDRDLISGFYNRSVGIEQIGHLLASAK